MFGFNKKGNSHKNSEIQDNNLESRYFYGLNETSMLLYSHSQKSMAFTTSAISNSHYETNFGVCSALGAANPKIGFLKVILRLAFKKPIFIMRIVDQLFSG
ncbi:hypothetical protein HCU40_02415 [Pseudanabaena biceps]|nr:hypothetical protein [Pseudanabaena biceps]